MPKKSAIRRAAQLTCVAAPMDEATEADAVPRKVTVTCRRRRHGCFWLATTRQKVAAFTFDRASVCPNSCTGFLDLEHLFRCSRKQDADDAEVEICVKLSSGEKRVAKVCLEEFLEQLLLCRRPDSCVLVIHESKVTLQQGQPSTCIPAPDWLFEKQVNGANDRLLKDEEHASGHQQQDNTLQHSNLIVSDLPCERQVPMSSDLIVKDVGTKTETNKSPLDCCLDTDLKEMASCYEDSDTTREDNSTDINDPGEWKSIEDNDEEKHDFADEGSGRNSDDESGWETVDSNDSDDDYMTKTVKGKPLPHAMWPYICGPLFSLILAYLTSFLLPRLIMEYYGGEL